MENHMYSILQPSEYMYMHVHVHVLYMYMHMYMLPIVRVHVILQSGLALAGQAREELSHNVAVLDVLVALEGVEVVAEVGHQLLVGLAVLKVGERELGREEGTELIT